MNETRIKLIKKPTPGPISRILTGSSALINLTISCRGNKKKLFLLRLLIGTATNNLQGLLMEHYLCVCETILRGIHLNQNCNERVTT